MIETCWMETGGKMDGVKLGSRYVGGRGCLNERRGIRYGAGWWMVTGFLFPTEFQCDHCDREVRFRSKFLIERSKLSDYRECGLLLRSYRLKFASRVIGSMLASWPLCSVLIKFLIEWSNWDGHGDHWSQLQLKFSDQVIGPMWVSWSLKSVSIVFESSFLIKPSV